MTNHRRLRALVVAAAAAALVASVAAPAVAAPPKRTQTPVITAKPASLTSSTTATFTFASSTPGAVYTCSLDGGTAKTCASPTTYTGLASGAHTFSVKATAPTARPSGAATATWTVDAVAPTAPSVTGPAALTQDKTPVISFSSPSTDVIGYTCSLDGAPATACTSGSAVAATAEGPHTFTVRASDAAGNVSSPVTIGWTLDTVVTPPVVLSGPPTLTSADSATFTFLSLDDDAATTCSLDGGAFAPCTSPVSYTGIGLGLHAFAVRATDPAANTQTASTQWTREATPWTFAWADPAALPAPLTNTTSAVLAFQVTGAVSVSCTVDGTPVVPCTSPVTLSGLGSSEHVFQLVIDAGLGTESTVSHHWVVDLVAPAAPVLEAPTGTVPSTSASIRVRAAVGDRLTCVVDGGIVACSPGSVVELANLAQGAHIVSVTASDRAGNVAAPVSVTWTVDTVAPTASITLPTSLVAPVRVVFSEPVLGAGANPVLSVVGGTAVPAVRTCLDVASLAVPCEQGVRSVVLVPVSRLVPGQSYAVSVNGGNAVPVVDLAGNATVALTKSFRAAVVQQENSPAITQSWKSVSTTAARGASYTTDNRRGARAAFTFTGTSFTVYPVSGPTFGYVDVYVDGVRKASWNQYAATLRFTSARTVKGLSSGSHRVALVVTGKKGSTKAKGAAVGIDALVFGGVAQKTPKLVTSWSRVKSYGALGYYRSVAGLGGQAAAMSFVGTGITWTYQAGPAAGIAVVYVDGVKRATVDQYSSTVRERATWSLTGLTRGKHTIKIVTTGTKRAASKGTSVTVDALTVR